MKISQLIEEYNGLYRDLDIENIEFDSLVKKDRCLYFCLNGNYNKESYYKNVKSNGGLVIVTDKAIDFPIEQIIVKDLRKQFALSCSKLYHNPQDKLKIIGITGTNGKTSTTYIVHDILTRLGKKVGIIGTNGIRYANCKIDTKLTTPDSNELFYYLNEMVNNHVEYVLMEVSAHSIYFDKIYGIKFLIGAFTNLTQDHLDFFGNLQDYYYTKARFFTNNYVENAVINIDDSYGRKLYDILNMKKYSYSLNHISNILYKNGIVFSYKNLLFKTSLIGKFNVYNCLCGIRICEALGFNLIDISSACKFIKQIEGRFNIIRINDIDVVIDFAHTPDGLENILLSLKDMCYKNIITVFGCGGNRDKSKRPIMGKIACKYSKFTIITSDNPRFENELDIISDICKGVAENNIYIIRDRGQAIIKAISLANKGDCVLIAGKGNEQFIDIQGKKIPFNDAQFIIDKYV